MIEKDKKTEEEIKQLDDRFELGDDISIVLRQINNVMQVKNKRYGNAALCPLGIFSKNSSSSGILTRMDDKLMRIKNSEEVRKNDLIDLIGYGVLYCIERKWFDLSELID